MALHVRNESKVYNHSITSSGIAKLLGENFSRFALYPDGINRVVIVKPSATIPSEPSGKIIYFVFGYNANVKRLGREQGSICNIHLQF
jgi:hypothetical protein